MAEKAAKGPKIPKIPQILQEGEILTVMELRYVYLKVIHNEGFENFLTVTYIWTELWAFFTHNEFG